MAGAQDLLTVKQLSLNFATAEGSVRAVRDLSFSLAAGDSLGIVGESGSGKSQSLLALMGLLARNSRLTGQAYFAGKDLLKCSSAELDQIRGRSMAMIFQDPMTALNPALRVHSQLTEVLRRHLSLSREQAYQRALTMLQAVGIADAAVCLRRYPHQLSGGMRQRVMIAMALLCQPQLLIADEPTTALDVTVQAQILALFAQLKRQLTTALILITHDFGVVAGLCERVLVMYAGRAVEIAPVDAIFAQPKHPYTRALLQSTPNLSASRGELISIAGSPPDMLDLPSGCAFAPRCPQATSECRLAEPELRACGSSQVACWRAS